MKKKLVIIIYGSTGDLSAKKILPALSQLLLDEKFSQNVNILALGRRNFDTQTYLDFISSLNGQINFNLKENLQYVNMDITSSHDYLILKNILKQASFKNSKFLHFFALAPNLVLKVSENLANSKIMTSASYNHNIIVEKPFGTNLKTSKEMKKMLWKFFDESQIYRVDHYLDKDVVENIHNVMFLNNKNIFKNRKVKKILIYALEKDGILSRGEYYETAGAIRDMVQSHLLQIVSLVTMNEPPCSLCNEQTDEKVKALKNIKLFKKSLIFGQYDEYLTEKNVSKHSRAETFFAGKLTSKLPRLKNVPIFLITGKKLKEKKTGIIFEFDDKSKLIFDINKSIIYFENEKTKQILFENKEELLPYAKLISYASNDKKEHFVRFDEIESSWKIVDLIEKKKKTLLNYKTNDDVKLFLENNFKGVFDEIL